MRRQLHGAAREAAAVRIAELAATGAIDRAIADELKISLRVVRYIRDDRGITAGFKQAPTRPRRRAGTCPACLEEDLELTRTEVLAPHYRLAAPGPRLVAPAVPCPGTGRPPTDEGNTP